MTHRHVITRSQRFAVDLPLRYRPVGDASWRVGRITNISGSGILFRPDGGLDVNPKVEMTFPLKPSSTHSPPAGTTVFCLGQIVRVEPTNGEVRLAVAASIRNYRFVRNQAPPAGRVPLESSPDR